MCRDITEAAFFIELLQACLYLKTSSTTSKSRLLEQLATNGELGCHMSSTEINTLISSLAQDYGKYEDILCKAAHHEEISQSYKIDGDPIVVPRPHLALIMSGTPEQFTGFFRSHENDAPTTKMPFLNRQERIFVR